MSDDAAQQILAPAQIDNGLKADAWEAFNSSVNERELGSKLQGMNLPDKVKADLWEAKRGISQNSVAPNIVTGQGMESAAAQQAHIALSGTGLQGRYSATGQKISGPNGEPLNAIEQQPTPQTNLAIALNRGANSPVPVTNAASVLYNPMTAAKTILGAKVGGAVARSTTKALGGGETAQNAAELGGNLVGGFGGGMAGESSLAKWISSSKSKGAELLQYASSKAGNAPVQISPQTDRIVEEIVKEGNLGGSPPKIISDFLKRVGPTVKMNPAEEVPLTYDEARILQSNASQLSASEKQAMKGRMGSLMKQFANSFSQDVQAAADQAGIGAEHSAGMQEYALASSRNRTLKNIGKYALPTAGGAGLMYELLRGIKR